MEKGKVKIKEDKVAEVLEWPVSQCVRDVKKFLELANYHRHFMKDFTKIALLLNRLTRKNEK